MRKPRLISPTELLGTIGTIFDGKNRSQPTHLKNRVETTDIDYVNYVNECEKTVSSILRFGGKNELSTALHRAFSTWRELEGLREEKECGDIILSAYLRQGKIRDYIEKLNSLIQRMDTMDDLDKVRFMAYNNYLYYLQQFIWDMREKIRQVESGEPPQLPGEDADTVAWFIHDECRSVSCLRDIPKTYEALKRLKGTLEIGRPMNAQQMQDKITISSGMDFFLLPVSKDDLAEMRRIEETLRDCISAMRKNIDNAKILYRAINTCFTDEWFSQLNPENEASIVNGLSKEELKAVYQDKIQEFQTQVQGIEF